MPIEVFGPIGLRKWGKKPKKTKNKKNNYSENESIRFQKVVKCTKIKELQVPLCL